MKLISIDTLETFCHHIDFQHILLHFFFFFFLVNMGFRLDIASRLIPRRLPFWIARSRRRWTSVATRGLIFSPLDSNPWPPLWKAGILTAGSPLVVLYRLFIEWHSINLCSIQMNVAWSFKARVIEFHLFKHTKECF